MPVLVGINMLKVFGYSFKDAVPPVSEHRAVEDLDSKHSENKHKLTLQCNGTKRYQEYKLNHIRFGGSCRAVSITITGI